MGWLTLDLAPVFLLRFCPAREWNSGLALRSPLKRTESLKPSCSPFSGLRTVDRDFQSRAGLSQKRPDLTGLIEWVQDLSCPSTLSSLLWSLIYGNDFES